jgi:hypothetical protein
MVAEHIHCTFCGRVVPCSKPKALTGALKRGSICGACASALNISVGKDQTAPH